MFLYQLEQLALGHDGVVDVEAGKLVLMAGEDAELLDKPVVERTVDVELEGADGVGDVFDGVALAMGVVVHGVDAPFVTSAVMLGMEDAVHDGVAELHVGVRHVDFGAQHLGAVGELAGLHAFEKVEVLLNGAVAVGAVFAGFGDGATAQSDFLLGLVVHIGKAFLDELDGPEVELVEIIAGIKDIGPLEPQPAYVLLDGVYIFGVFLHGIGVVETQVGLAAILLGKAKIETDRLGMTDVQIAVGLGGEARENGLVGALSEPLFDDFFQKITRCVFFHLYKLFIIIHLF